MVVAFSLEPGSLCHKVIKSKHGLHLNGCDAKAASNATHRRPWKLISQVYSSFLPLLGCNEKWALFPFMGESSVGRDSVFRSFYTYLLFTHLS